MSDERDYLWDRSGPVDPFVARMEQTMSVLAEPPREAKVRALTPKVLRVAVVADGKVCDELHQVAPGSVSAGRRLGSKLVLYDTATAPRDYRKRAPLWLGVGLTLGFAGFGLFALELSKYREAQAEQEAQAGQLQRGQITAFEPWDSGGRSWLGIALLLAGLVPLVAGVTGLRESSPRDDKTVRKGPPAPDRHGLFDYRDGKYFLDLPADARGKISLGKKAATVSQLRKRFGRGDRLRVRLNDEAKGKLILGDTTLLFQFAEPAPVPKREPLPPGLVDPWRLLALSPLAAIVYLCSFVLLGGAFFYVGVIAEPSDEFEPGSRFVDAMGITKYEEKEEEPEPEEEVVEEDQLAQEEEEKVEDKEIEEKLDKILDKKPEQFSDQAMKEARGVGVARVLGTYGGPGEGSVFDIIQDTENNLGELMADGTSIIESDAGSVSEFVPGGKGISAQGGMVQGDKIGGKDEPGLDDKTKKEKKINPKMESSTGDIYGDVDKTAVQATIRRRTSALKVCYEKALRTQPGLKGKITYTIAISTVGRVTSVQIEEDTLGDASVRSCTQAKIKGWRFPTAGAEEAAEVTFSVVYSGAQ
jgi:outer membrane biosynthesis protein TonB